MKIRGIWTKTGCLVWLFRKQLLKMLFSIIVVWQSSGTRQVVVMESSGSHHEVVRQLSGCCQAVVRLLSGNCQAVVGQWSGSHQAFLRNSSGSPQAVLMWLWDSRQAVIRQSSNGQKSVRIVIYCADYRTERLFILVFIQSNNKLLTFMRY